MSTPREIAAARTRRLIIGLVVLVVVLALALTVAVVVLARGDGETTSAPDPQATPTPTMDPTADGALLLPSGNDTIDGRYPVNFPHTPEGAVGMLAAYSNNDVTVDPQTKARARQVYVDELRDQELSVLEQSAALWIEMDLSGYDVGMTLEELPDQAEMSSIPLAVVYEQVDSDTVDVALLEEISIYDGISRRGTSTAVREARCVWREDVRGGDWVLSDEFPSVTIPDVADPREPGFDESGWIAVQGGVGT
ncbi:hypothetical protein GCM10027294_53190 [Marinactinospora endophytica]